MENVEWGNAKTISNFRYFIAQEHWKLIMKKKQKTKNQKTQKSSKKTQKSRCKKNNISKE